jgi:hypothetical protein
MRRFAALGVTGSLALALTLGVPDAGLAGSLPAREGTAPRPGPAVLYEHLARAPQLENERGSAWHAPSILVSGASTYRQGSSSTRATSTTTTAPSL